MTRKSPNLFNLHADIIPNEGLSGLKLREHISILDRAILNLECSSMGEYKLVKPYEAEYSFSEGQVKVGVDIRNGRIFKLIAAEGYKGKLFNKIYVGMTVKQLFELDSRFYYDEAKEAIFCKGIEGLLLDVQEIDPLPSKVVDMKINAISVYAKEIDTPKGQAGDW